VNNRSKKTLVLSLAGFFLLFISFAAPCHAKQEPSCLGKKPGVTIKLSEDAFITIDYAFQLHSAWRDTGSGADLTEPTTDLYFRRNRLTLGGQSSEKLSFSVELEHAGDRNILPLEVTEKGVTDYSVLEANVTADLAKGFKITAGRKKTPFTREILDGCFTPLSVDRSLFIYTPMQHSRDTGVVLWGNLADSKFQYRLAAMEGQDSSSAPERSPRYTARMHFAFLDPEDGYGYSGTYLGTKMVLTIGAGAQYEPGAVYTDIISKTGDKDYTAWTADAFLEYPIGMAGTLTLSGAYLNVSFDGAYKGGGNADPDSFGIDGEKNGWYAKAGYLIADNIGPGQVQPFVRYEEWNYAFVNGVNDQKIKWLGAGLNYLINGQALRLSVEYSKTDFVKEENAKSQDFTTIITMLQFGL
jgi:hypothetical protein